MNETVQPSVASTWRWILPITVWLLAMIEALQIGRVILPGGMEHAICGPWGCGPRFMDLVAYHSFELVVISGPCFLLKCRSPSWSRWVGTVLLIAGVSGLLGLLVNELLTQWSVHREHFLQRYLFRVVTSIDLPALEAIAGGCYLLWRPRRQAKTDGLGQNVPAAR